MTEEVFGSMDSSQSNSRHRRRVPVTCLNCRRRKVKCDKQKPACGGCVKNGVGHLCEYLEPHWTSSTGETAKTAVTVVPTMDEEKQRQLEELRQVKSSNERIINNQRKEIEDLKRQLAFNNHLSTGNNDRKDDSAHQIVEVLTKLNPLLAGNKDVLEVDSNYMVNFGRRQFKPDYNKELYSWVSIIKLDPKLSNLWHKINNMQKIYFLYKRSVRLKISEVDFTSSADSSANGARTCPVVLCDLNFLDDSSKTVKMGKTPEPKAIAGSLPSPQQSSTISQAIQKMWLAVTNCLRGKEKLTPDQMCFLLDYYFTDPMNETSKSLVYYYKEDIKLTYTVSNKEILLAFDPDDEDQPLQLKGVFVGMLSLILGETLDIMRCNIKNEVDNEYVDNFKALFPQEIVYLGLPSNIGSKLKPVHEYLHFCFDFKNPRNTFNRLLPAISCALLLLGRDIVSVSKEGNDRNEIVILCTLKIVLGVVFNEDEPVEIWKNPSQILLNKNESKKKIKDLRIHIFYLWNEIIRCLNILSFSLIQHHISDKRLSVLMERAYSRIEEVQKSQAHIKYAQTLKANNLDDLVTSLKINYLLSNVHIFLNRAVSNLLGVKLTIQQLDDLIGECGSWLEDQRVSRLSKITSSEFEIMLHFCNIYITYIMFLQSEEGKMESLKENLITTIFIKLDGFFKFVEKLIDSEDEENQYIYSATTEALVPMVQILVAIFLRVTQRSEDKNDDLLKQLSAYYYSVSKSLLSVTNDLPTMLSEKFSNRVTSCISRLGEKLTVNKAHSIKLLKLWKFYLSIIDGAKKFGLNYNKLHANIPAFNKLLNDKQITSSEFEKCPVSHVHAKAETETPTNGKCPFDHTKIAAQGMEAPNMKRPINTESSGSKRAKLETVGQGDLKSFDAVDKTNNIVEQVTRSYMDQELLYPPVDFDVNLNSFANLDLDFLNDYSLFESYPGKNIEGYFQ